MADEKSPAKEIAEGLRSIFDRLGEFFHIFDLSYIISGTVAFGALAVLYLRECGETYFPFAPWVGAAALIIACYVCGMLCFAAGRLINTHLFRKNIVDSAMNEMIASHLTSSSLADYNENRPAKRYVDALYPRLWAEATSRLSDKAAYRHLLRFWVTAATYDGLGAALLVWAAVALVVGCSRPAEPPISPCLGGICSLLFVGAAFLALHRGALYLRYQVEDLITALAADRSRLRMAQD
jgi:hypothetical protein